MESFAIIAGCRTRLRAGEVGEVGDLLACGVGQPRLAVAAAVTRGALIRRIEGVTRTLAAIEVGARDVRRELAAITIDTGGFTRVDAVDGRAAGPGRSAFQPATITARMIVAAIGLLAGFLLNVVETTRNRTMKRATGAESQ